MRLFNGGKKAARFVFVSMPASILGINQLRMGNRHIVDLWKSLSSTVCPECDKGVLLRQEEEPLLVDQGADGRSRYLYLWKCNHCDFSFFEEDEATKVRNSAIRYRNERVKVELSAMEYAERSSLAKRHRISARIFFCSSFLVGIGFIYMLTSGAALLLAMNWLSIAFAMWIFGMKKSYRAWQITSGHLFVKGAFWHWFQNEKWLT